MKIGFTGTREGMTERQEVSLLRLLVELHPTQFGHGDCIGSDNEAAELVRHNFTKCKIICYPPKEDRLRAFNDNFDEIRECKSYLDRNRDIVNECEVLIATPKSIIQSGGTWYTVRFSIFKGKKTYVILPEGNIEVK